MKKIPVQVLMVAAIAIIFGMLLSVLLIKGPKKDAKVQIVTPFPTTFPDVKNDPAYKNFLSTDNFDPTQSVHVGNSQNSTPFSGGQ